MSRPRHLMPASGLFLLLSASVVCAADAKPLARVGNASVSAEALTARLAKLPDFQRAALADGPEQLKRRVLEDVLIPELLYAEEAERLKLAEQPAFRSRERELLRGAMDRALEADVAVRGGTSADEIRTYFEANRKRFDTPERLRLWRILVDDEALAKRIISESGATDGVQRWSQFARDQSLDKATHLRNGDLGFVHPDGDTDTPTLRVDPTLFAAAARLADGELGPGPIQEGGHWAVIWRRGSLKAVHRSLAQEEPAIRQVLQRKRLIDVRNELLDTLRRKYVTALNESALEGFAFNAEGVPERQSAARSAHAAAAAASAPSPGEHGDR